MDVEAGGKPLLASDSDAIARERRSGSARMGVDGGRAGGAGGAGGGAGVSAAAGGKKSMAVEWLAAGFAAVVGFSPLPQFHHVILERDPALSAPYVKDGDSQVPTLALFALVLIGAPLGMFVFQLILRRGVRRDHPLYSIGHGQLVMWQSLMFTLALTSIVKNYAGRPRPNFFELCDYKGFALARQTNNYTAYWAATTPNAVGDPVHCAQQQYLGEAYASFPSGHSSLTMAVMLVISQYIWATLPSASSVFTTAPGVRIILSCWPVIGAALVAASRTRDNWHNFGDVLAGAIVGALVALWVFRTRMLPQSLTVDASAEIGKRATGRGGGAAAGVGTF